MQHRHWDLQTWCQTSHHQIGRQGRLQLVVYRGFQGNSLTHFLGNPCLAHVTMYQPDSTKICLSYVPSWHRISSRLAVTQVMNSTSRNWGLLLPYYKCQGKAEKSSEFSLSKKYKFLGDKNNGASLLGILLESCKLRQTSYKIWSGSTESLKPITLRVIMKTTSFTYIVSTTDIRSAWQGIQAHLSGHRIREELGAS